MHLERLFYSNRLASVINLIDGSWSFLSNRRWRYAGWRQKLLIVGLALMLIIGIFQGINHWLKSSQSTFYDRYNLAPGTAKSTRVDASRASQTEVLPKTLPPFIQLGESTEAQAQGRAMNAARFGDQHWPALLSLWTRESGWNPAARNRSSGACGIPQALPCRKIPDMSLTGQLEWGLNYIGSRYGNPSNAWRFWLSHHWY